jgi:glycosyltransferase involved in cell wall biosynthesis
MTPPPTAHTSSAGGPAIRVLYLDHVAQLSGGELALLRLVPHLDGVAPRVLLAEPGPLVQAFADEGVPVAVLAMDDSARDLRKGAVTARLPFGAIAGTLRYVRALTRRLRSERPDVVHANSLKSGVCGSIAARLAGVRFVWHVRDRISEDYLPRPAVALVRWQLRWLTDAVIANSTATLATVGRVPHPTVVPSTLPSAAAAATTQARPADPDRALTFAVLGRLAPWKGQDVAIRAFAEAFPDGDERLVVIGAALFGEDDYERELRDLVAARGLGDRVVFAGFQRDVPAALAGVDALVHASVTAEPFGQVVLEGMAAGLPVIAADAGGPAEIIEEGTTGLLYPMGDAAALADRLRVVAADPALRARLGAAARPVVERYRPERVAGTVTDLYRTVTQLPPRRWGVLPR